MYTRPSKYKSKHINKGLIKKQYRAVIYERFYALPSTYTFLIFINIIREFHLSTYTLPRYIEKITYWNTSTNFITDPISYTYPIPVWKRKNAYYTQPSKPYKKSKFLVRNVYASKETIT